ncbi:putative T7SS-secreted protein [Kitasatospora sp. NPDC096147]|uniref:putative T7SS-secreted protein n=1 Tax=Kitasatospora sp. NPDC096147 TaxID=3364093 RepID=UPI0038024D2E
MSDAADFPALGFDPAPGNPGNVDALVTRLNTAANALSSAHQSLSSLTRTGGSWQGDAATAFAGKVGELPAMLRDSDDAIRAASQQLNAWQTQLLSYQSTARKYEAEAQAAKQRCEQCERAEDQAKSRYDSAADAPAFRLAGQMFTDDAALQDAQNRIDSAQRELTRAGDELNDAKRSLEDAKDAFEAIVKQAKELKEDHQDSAAKIAKALRKANQNAPETSMWDKFKDSLKRAGHAIKEWATKHADLLKKIGDWMSIASAVLGVAALCTVWFPPLSGALALAGGAMSAGALATHGLAKLGGANVSAMDLVGDGLGILPIGKLVGTAARPVMKVTTKLVPKVEQAVVNGSRVLRQSPTEMVRQIGKNQVVQHMDDATRGMAVRASRLADGATDVVTEFKALPGMGNRLKFAWEKHVAETAYGTAMDGFKSTKIANLPGLRSIPSFQNAVRADGSLDPMSWWSRGINAGPSVPGIGLSIYNQLTGEN